MTARSDVKTLSLIQNPADILVIRFKCIGDILFTLPAIHALRDNFPGARITFLTLKENAPLLECFRDVNEVVTLDRASYRRGNLFRLAAEVFSLLKIFRKRKFGLVIDYQAYGETALLTWLTRAPQRWGPLYQDNRRWAYNGGMGRGPLHPAEWNLSLLRQCGLSVPSGRNEFVLPERTMREARELFTSLNLNPDHPTLYIQPFTSAELRTWPFENYLALAEHWRLRGVQILFGGGPGECTRLEPARRAGFAVSASAPLLVSAGLMKLSTLVLGGDTGLLHLAVAMNVRVITLAVSSKAHPFQHPEWNLTPSQGSGMTGITLPSVVEACTRAFAELKSHETEFEPAAMAI